MKVVRTTGPPAFAAIVSQHALSRSVRQRHVGHNEIFSGPGNSSFTTQAVTRCADAKVLQCAIPVGQRITELIEKHDVVIFSKSTCPFCAKVKDTLHAEGVTFHSEELDDLLVADMEAWQEHLQQLTGARTVPRIFVRGSCIGGCDDVMGLQQSGKLLSLLPQHTVPNPISSFQIKRTEEDWRRELGSDRYYVLRLQGTEPSGSHEYDMFMPSSGYFACGACEFPLYSADSKFESSCGWPVFDRCYFSAEAGGCHVGTKKEFLSVEITCKRCQSHLGHVFFDAFSYGNSNGERH